MFSAIEFMSGFLAVVAVISLLVTFGILIDGATGSWSDDHKRYATNTFLFTVVTMALSIQAHWIYSTQYEIPRREHIEYFLNHQREFQVDSVRQIGKNALYEYCVTEK